jgi:Domain of unknown function (DUF4451)
MPNYIFEADLPVAIIYSTDMVRSFLHVLTIKPTSRPGISAVAALPFSPPVDFRTTVRSRPSKTEKTNILEGKCHKCLKWIAVEGVKDVAVKVCLASF